MRTLKWVGIAVVGMLAVLVLGYGVVFYQSESRIHRVYSVDPGPLEVATQEWNDERTVPALMGLASDGTGIPARTPGGNGSGGGPDWSEKGEILARGEHIAATRGCRDCHGEDLGGGLFADAMPVFRLWGSNLTPGGVGATYSDTDWIRSIRHGVRPDGESLLFMPSYEYYYLGDEDLAALVAYLKSLPAVERETGKNAVGPMGRILFLAGKLPLVPAEMIDHEAPRPTVPPPGATVAYGEYLAVGCTGCHGPEFSGGLIPGAPPEWPPALNITPDAETGIGSWDREDFFRAMREGKRRDGTDLQPQFMPWPNFARFTDQELEALWMYLERVEPKTYGGR